MRFRNKKITDKTLESMINAGLDLTNTVFHDCHVIGTLVGNLNGIVFNHCNLSIVLKNARGSVTMQHCTIDVDTETTYDHAVDQFPPLQLRMSRCNGRIGAHVENSSITIEGSTLRHSTFRDCGLVVSDSDISNSSFHGNLTSSVFSRSNLRGITVRGNLTGARFSLCDLSYADMQDSDLFNASFGQSNLFRVSFARSIVAQMHSSTDQSFAPVNFSQTIGMLDPSEWMLKNFVYLKKRGVWIVWKVIDTGTPFNEHWPWPPPEPGLVLTESVQDSRWVDCGCGVNFATLPFIDNHYQRTIMPYDEANKLWMCEIPVTKAFGVVVPHGNDGKARCSWLMLVKPIAFSEARAYHDMRIRRNKG